MNLSLVAAVPAAWCVVAFSALGAQAARSLEAAAPVDQSGDWSGWYAGGQVGYSQGNANAAPTAAPSTRAGDAFGRLDGGLHVGYTRALPSQVVLGAEADIAFPYFIEDGAIVSPHTTPASNVTEKIDVVSTLRGRVGYVLDHVLLYGTGGFAPSQTRFIDSSAAHPDPERILRVRTGWALGAGADVAIGRGWTARVEYLYERLGRADAVFPSGATLGSNANSHGLRLGVSYALGSSHAHARAPAVESETVPAKSWNIHAQDTFIDQGYTRFHSPYEGINSLTGASQVKNTESATAFVDVRLWNGAELYVDPEIDQGFGLNDTHGVSAFPNGEAQKASFPMARLVIDRLALRQIFGLGGAREAVSDAPNQLAAIPDISRITIVAGRLAVTDYFDGNSYANDPRVNFLNWNIYGAGAYDWTMDQLSWTWGALAELNQKAWAARIGYFLLPAVSSDNAFDTHIPARGEYAAELEWRYSALSQPGKLRVFGWVNHGIMGGYADALTMPVSTPNYPDITLTREVRTNPGVVINAEQGVTGDIGIFSRASWSPGRVEILGGTDCSESLSLGGVFKGGWWGRPNDNVGVSAVIGGLSPIARAFFAAGGVGILIGDGQLNYSQEKVLETYYAFAVARWATLSLDYQYVVDPAYNADRGPVSIYALRIHTAF